VELPQRMQLRYFQKSPKIKRPKSSSDKALRVAGSIPAASGQVHQAGRVDRLGQLEARRVVVHVAGQELDPLVAKWADSRSIWIWKFEGLLLARFLTPPWNDNYPSRSITSS